MAYTKVKRKDGGFDFFNGDQKINVDQYVQGTGTNKTQLVDSLAQAGDKVSQRFSAIQKLGIAPKAPTKLGKSAFDTVNDFDNKDVDTQRKIRTDIENEANRKDFNSANDIQRTADAKKLLQAIDTAGVKKGGNLKTFGQDLFGGLVNTLAKPGESVQDTVLANNRLKNVQNIISGKTDLDINQVAGATQNIYQNNLQAKAVTKDDGKTTVEKLSPIDFVKKFAGEGADVGLTVAAPGSGAGLVSKVGKQAAQQILKDAGKSTLAQTAAQTGADYVNGREVSPQSIVQNAALTLGGELVGATPTAIRSGTRTTGTVIKNQVQAIGDARHAAAEAESGLPRTQYQAINDNEAYTLGDYADYRMKRDNFLKGGSSDAVKEINQLVQNARVTADHAGIDIVNGSPAEIDRRIADYLEKRDNYKTSLRMSSEGGFARLPGGKDVLPGQESRTQELQTPKSQQALPEVQETPTQLPIDKSLQPDISTSDYIKQQADLQRGARGAGGLSLPGKIKSEFRSKVIDSLAPIEDTLARANRDGAGINISDANHITPQLDRVLRADTIAGQYIRDNGLAKVIQDVPNTQEFDQYLIARHAADLKKNGIETGRNAEADAKLVSDLAPQYEAQAKQIKAYSDRLLDSATDYGLISKDLATSLKIQYPNYVPVNRIFGEGEESSLRLGGGGKASRSTQSVVQRIKGSTREIESPLSSLASKTNDLIKQGETNKAAQILTSYKDLPGNPFSLRELKPNEIVGSKHVVTFLDNGKPRRFETTPEIESAAKSLNKEQIGILGKIVRIPTRVLRLGATGINSGFALANLAKDMASAAINSEHPLRASILNPVVAKQSFGAALNHGSKSYQELLREGAGGTSFDIARDQPVKTVAKIRAEKNVGTKVAYTVTHPGELLRAVENTIGRSEEFTRAMQYFGNKQAALKSGKTEAQATRYGAHAARNNTINFARAGDYGAVLNSALPYLNAGIQGSRTLLRNVKNRPLQTLTKISVLGTLPVVTVTTWNLADEKRRQAYEDISDYEKQGNLIIVPPNPVKDPETGRWNVIKIPVSQELANLNNIARNLVESARGQQDGFNIQKTLGDLIGTTTSLQVQDPRAAVGQFIPQALKPAVETLTNQNLFTGNSIVPESQKNLPTQDQFGEYTSNTAIALGKLTGQSPRVIDNAIKTAAGGAGQTAVNASDQLLNATGIETTNPVAGKSIGESISNRFSGASSIPDSDKADKAYEKAREQLIKNPDYKSLSQEDQAKALNRLQTDINAVTYNENPNPRYDQKKLTSNQRKLQNGSLTPDNYAKPPSDSSSLSKTKLDPKSKEYEFLDQSSSISNDDKEAWNTKPVDKQYAKFVDNINKVLPEGLPPVPATNAVAELYAKFAKDSADNKWSKLERNKNTEKLVQNAYKTELSKDQRFISTLSDDELYDAVNSGEIDKADLDTVVGLDNTLHTLGFSQNIGNKLRKALGYGTITASKSSLTKATSKAKGFTIPSIKFDRVASTSSLNKLVSGAGRGIG